MKNQETKVVTISRMMLALAISIALPIRSNAQVGGAAGAVFVMTNAADKNEILTARWAGVGVSQLAGEGVVAQSIR